jgi:hypothetical protein
MLTLDLVLSKIDTCNKKIEDIKIDLADGSKYNLTDDQYEKLILFFLEVTQELRSIKEVVLVLDDGLKFSNH